MPRTPHLPKELRRVVVRGSTGAGKSTFARELATRLDLPYVELDALHHLPGWTEASAEELRARVEAALDDDRGGVVDGNYDGKLGTLVVGRAELIVWLDLPLRVTFPRLLRRTVRRARTGEELWNGNRESWRGSFASRESVLLWLFRTHWRNRREWPARFAGRQVVRLRTPGAAREWLLRTGGGRP
jgi:adenylate kinase family enzyme